MYCIIYFIFVIYEYINLLILYYSLKKFEKFEKKNFLDFMYKIFVKKLFYLKES